ncbi:MAG: RIP metalloprotease RseP [Flavobacteriaceae bacterium]
MTVIIQIAQFILIISILVILHELGHFIPAKLFKTKVEKFYLFFDYKFSLFKKKIGDTVYGIGWIPFGGYVKIAGMIDESMDMGQMKKPPKSWEFRSKPAWQRFIIMIGGVTVNFLLAWFLYTILLSTKGETFIDNSKLTNGIYVDEIGEKLGLKKGDKVVSVDGKSINKFMDASYDYLSDNVPLNILLGDEMTVNRNGKMVTFPLKDEIKKLVLKSQGKSFISPAFHPFIGVVKEESPASKGDLKSGDQIISINNSKIMAWDELVHFIKKNKNDTLNISVLRNNNPVALKVAVPDSAIIGIGLGYENMNKYVKENFITHNEYSFGASIPKGFSKTINNLTNQVRQFKLIFNKKTEGYKKVKGPIGIVSQMPKAWNWTFIWYFTAMFSVWLAFLNLLPIPALDGGHIVFLLYEMISGRPPSQKVMEIAQIAGFFFILAIMALVFGNDLYNVFLNIFK